MKNTLRILRPFGVCTYAVILQHFFHGLICAAIRRTEGKNETRLLQEQGAFMARF